MKGGGKEATGLISTPIVATLATEDIPVSKVANEKCLAQDRILVVVKRMQRHRVQTDKGSSRL